MTNRVRQWRSSRNLSQQELAERCGTTQPTIYKIEMGQRKLTDRWLERLAIALSVRPADLLEGDAEEVTIRGTIDAVTWSPTGEWPTEQWYGISAPPDDRFPPKTERHGYEIKGKAADRKYNDGTILVCVDLEVVRYPCPGKRHVVQIIREDGQKCLSVRELSQDSEGKMWLVSLSTDPALSGPILLEDHSARVVALVTGSYQRE